MKFTFFFISYFWISTITLAQTDLVKDWADKVVPEATLQNSENRPFVRFTALSAVPEDGLPRFAPLVGKEFDELGAFQFVTNQEALLNYQLNFSGATKGNPAEIMKRICDSSFLQFIVVGGEAKSQPWQIFACKDDLSEPILEAAAPKSANDKGVFDWLVLNLGFSSIILDVRENGELLVVGAASQFKERRQAVVIRESISEIKFPKRIQEGDALVETLKISGRFALFRVVILSEGVEKLSPGAKIVMRSQKAGA